MQQAYEDLSVGFMTNSNTGKDSGGFLQIKKKSDSDVLELYEEEDDNSRYINFENFDNDESRSSNFCSKL